MVHILKKGVPFTLVLTLIVTMCLGGMGTTKIYAISKEEAALSVYVGNNDEPVKSYTLDELKDIAEREGNVKYKFSGYNRNPSFYTFGDVNAKADVKEVVGPTVKGILDDAAVTYEEKQLISFAAPDGVTESFVAEDLFQTRYYFPKGKIAVPYKGTPAQVENYADAETVVPIIDLHNASESVLRFGQVAPNEQNYAAFIKYIADGGKIIVGNVQENAWESINSANYSGGIILPKTKLEFQIPKSVMRKKAVVYFTTDGTEPEPGDAIYNYDKYENVQELLAPETEGEVTYKFKVIGYGKLDSETTTFKYNVVNVPAPAEPSNFRTKINDDKTVLLTWNAVDDADGYEILKYNSETGKMDVFKDISDGNQSSMQDTGTRSAWDCIYQIRSYKKLTSGQKAYSTESPEQSVVIRNLAASLLKSVEKTGYESIQVKWSRVSGAEGYEVWRNDGVSKKYTLVKKIVNGSTDSWKNTGLKTGRKYTYKVRAYRAGSRNNLYSAYSGAKSATPVMAKPSISKLTPGSKRITVKWGRIAGANGYKIYRSTSKNSKYKCVKTINKGSTFSWKNTGLKKGKRYYYKVRAYRIVDKKYVYSNISSVKYIKVK